MVAFLELSRTEPERYLPNLLLTLFNLPVKKRSKGRSNTRKYYEERPTVFRTDEEQVEVWEMRMVNLSSCDELATVWGTAGQPPDLTIGYHVKRQCFFRHNKGGELREIIQRRAETRDFGFGPVEVTRYELSRFIDMEMFDYSRTDYE